MAHSQSFEHRIYTLRHCEGRQPDSIWHGAGQQAHSGNEDKLASLLCGKGKPEHAAQILDANKVRRKDIRHTNRIDEFCHGIPPQSYARECAAMVYPSRAYLAGVSLVVKHTFQEVRT